VAPDERGQRVAAGLQIANGAGVADGGNDLAPVTHDASVGQQAFDVALPEAGHRRDVEPGEGATKGVALAEDRQPRQPALEPLEAELLEDADLIGDRATPLVVVVPA